ncbi:MAG: efflux RND transporter permease subunit, partial [Acidobacteria bacterium]|nr:efflux RND transporter permease subunit [Acidobacteriota bacterium]
QSGTNTVKVVQTVKERLEQIRAALPPDLHVDIIRDQSIFIEASVTAIYEHLLLGGLLASLVVFLFMRNWRASLIAALAIPTSIISTFLMMRWAGFTINTVTLLGLTVAVGIVIDDAIVVLENIFRYIEEKKYKPHDAAIAATKEIGLAVMATTLSLIVVFMPVIFLGSIAGRWLQSFGVTAAFAIAVSLLVSFTLTPMLSSRYLKVATEEGKHHHSSKEIKIYHWMETRYMRLLAWSLAHRKTVVAICVQTYLTIIPMGIWIGIDFITQDDQDEFEVAVRTSEGTSLEGTDAVLHQIEDRIRQLPHIEHLLTTVNSGGQGSVTNGSVYVRLTPQAGRDVSQFALMDRARAALQDIPGIVLSVQNVGAISSSAFRNTPVNVGLRGPDLAELSTLASQIMERMKKVPVLLDVDTSLNVGNPEVHIAVDREKAADLGVDVSAIAETMRLMLSGGAEITKFKEGDELYEVRLRVRPDQRQNPESLASFMAPTSSGRLVRLDNVAQIVRGTGPVQIDRYNRQRQVTLSANLRTGAPLGQSLEEVRKIIAEAGLPVGYDYQFMGFGKFLQDLVSNFLLAFFLAFIFMYIVLAAQFESFVHPIVILSSLPLAVPFALLSLFVTGKSLSMFGAIGILLLFGIVKKNSILQIDFTNRLRREHGYDRHTAILEANRARLRPILMTTLSIVVAMIPTALAPAQVRPPALPLAS